MKTLFISSLCMVLLTLAIFSCKDENKQDPVKVTPGGCNLDQDLKSTPTVGPDTVYCSFNNNLLKIFVGYNRECCIKYSAQGNISGDTLFMQISTIENTPCNCICYYTYEFEYPDISHNYFYKVMIDNFLFSSGTIIH